MPRRLAITGPHRVEVIDYAEPALTPGQVRVRTEIASGKHGTTLAGFEEANLVGQRFDQQMRVFVAAEPDAQAASHGERTARATGTMGVGTVEELGPDVTCWRLGDRVFGPMDIRETNVCLGGRLWELGELDPCLALCVEPAYVAFHCIRESQVRYGDAVAVIGLGALGLLAVRMAAGAGAETVIAVDPLANRREWAARNGADHTLNPEESDAAVEVHRLTGGTGVDVAIDLAGVYRALGTAIRSVRVGGTVCAAGFYQGEAHDIWLGREWHHNRLNVVVPHGCGWGHPPRDYPRWDERRAQDCIVQMMRKGRLTAPGLLQPIVPLEEGPDVWRIIEDEPARVIKYAVRFP